MFSRPLSEHFASFPARVESLEDIREFVQGALSESPLGHSAVAGLLLAIEEAVTNVIRHGYLYGPGTVRLRVRRSRRRVQIVITDNGRPYEADFDAKPDPVELARTGRRGGLGLLLLQKVTDKIDYHRQGGTNTLTLTKHVRPVGAPRGPVRSFSRRIAWAGYLSVAAATLIGGVWFDREARTAVISDFFARWAEFGQTVAASATQHIFNERSDAEFDQLVVGLKSALPELRYLVILDRAGRVRADSESPERVHEIYRPPSGAASGETGNWPVTIGEAPGYHFCHVMMVRDEAVGSVVLGVAESMLSMRLDQSRGRVILWAMVAFILGELLVTLIAIGTAQPLRRIGDILQRAKTEGSHLSAPSTAPDEVQQVLQAVNEMTAAVARTEKDMARQEAARRELQQAEQLQRALLPEDLPEIPGYDAAAAYRMARNVGGDYYDLFSIGDGHSQWVLIVADVAGKGFPAALVMTAVRTAVRLLAPGCTSPAEILVALNRYLERHHTGGPFVTAVCAILDPATHVLTVASAGHTPVIGVRAESGVVEHINPSGRPVGIGVSSDDARDFEGSLLTQSFRFGPGDTLAFYTDGLSEAQNREGADFGVEGLERTLLETRSQTTTEIVDAILDRCDRFADSEHARDDVTLLVLRRKSEVAAAVRVSSPGNGNGRGSGLDLLKEWLAETGLPSPVHRTPDSFGAASTDETLIARILDSVAQHPDAGIDTLSAELSVGETVSEKALPGETIEHLLSELGLPDKEGRRRFSRWAKQRQSPKSARK